MPQTINKEITPEKITPKNQVEPDRTLKNFLSGVLYQAHIEGYGIHDQGRLAVKMLRLWEAR